MNETRDATVLRVWRIVLVLVALVLAWQVVTNGLGRHYAERLQQGDQGAAEKVLTWLPNHPRALFEQGSRLLADDAEAGEAMLARAYEADPTDPRPLIVLAARLAEAGDLERADALVEIADTLAPVNPSRQREIALYWDGREQPARALAHLSRVMEADASGNRQFYPVWLNLAEEPALRSLLLPYATTPPSWWAGFFRFAAVEAKDAETVRLVFNMRRQSGTAPITPEERAAYLGRLEREGLIDEAYLVWVNGLSDAERDALGLLYNGSFEQPLSNAGFGWHLRHPRVEAATLATAGAAGERALELRFRALETRFQHLHQPLFLDAGTYRLSGQVRSERLKTQGGLRWQVRCRLPERAVLGESARLFGPDGWKAFAFDFEVPDSCRYQELRLVSAGQRSFELSLDGPIWLDDLAINRVAELDAAARADALTRQGSLDDGEAAETSAEAGPDSAAEAAEAESEDAGERGGAAGGD